MMKTVIPPVGDVALPEVGLYLKHEAGGIFVVEVQGRAALRGHLILVDQLLHLPARAPCTCESQFILSTHSG